MGFTYGSIGEAHAGPSNRSDMFVARFGRAGKLQWIRQVGAVTAPQIPSINGDPGGPGGDASGWELASDLAVRADGSILITGYTYSNLAETNGGGGDLIVGGFGPTGDLLWLRQVGVETAANIGPTPGATKWGDPWSGDGGTSIVLDPAGGFYVGGYTGSDFVEDNGGEYDFLLAHFDDDGHLEWARQLGAISAPLVGFDASSLETPSGLALHPAGKLIMTGTTDFVSSPDYFEWMLLLGFGLDGTPQRLDWLTSSGQDHTVALAIDGAGRIYVAGNTRSDVVEPNPSESADVRVLCYDADFQPVWDRQIGETTASELGLIDVSQDEHAYDMQFDSRGGLVLAGITAGSLDDPNAGLGDLFCLEMNASDGTPRWVSQIGSRSASRLGLDASDNEVPGFGAFDFGPRGSILLGGSTRGSLVEPHAGAGDLLMLRLSPVGKLE